MTIKYKDLFHGPFTRENKGPFHRIYFNTDLKLDIDANFILIENDLDDYDLFELIQEESEHAKDINQRFIHIVYENNLDNLNLLETLRFDLEWIELYKLNAKHSKPKKSETITELTFETLDLYLKDFENESLDYQNMMKKKMFHLLKSKNAKTYLLLEEDTLIGKITTIQNKNFIEIQNFEVKEAYQNKGFGTSLHHHVLQDMDAILLCFKDSEASKLYQSWGYEKVSTHLSAIKSL